MVHNLHLLTNTHVVGKTRLHSIESKPKKVVVVFGVACAVYFVIVVVFVVIVVVSFVGVVIISSLVKIG